MLAIYKNLYLYNNNHIIYHEKNTCNFIHFIVCH